MKYILAPPFLFLFLILSCKENPEGLYVCKPCDQTCDKLTFEKPGTCPHCGMKLFLKSEIVDESQLKVNDIQIHEGSGVFLVEGGDAKRDKPIKVYYHKPQNYSAESRILLVIPGAGRNGDSYRDAWIEESETYGVLILSLQYGEDAYPFEAYHLGGVIKSSNLREVVRYVENSNEVILDEEKFTSELSPDPNTWLFQDLDRIFDLVVQKLQGSQNRYDVFGHSAGGQILHRLALLYPKSKADRIVAANAGFYTLPSSATKFPFGIQHIPNLSLKESFGKKLILLIGEQDNESETGGTLLRSSSADAQGAHRLARARYFFQQSQQIAAELNTDFRWKLEIVPQVGHNHEKMGNATAIFLYGHEEN